MPNLIDMTGRTVGRLTVLGRVANSPSGAVRWLCRCLCGNTSVAMGAALRSRHTASCGCIQREAVTKHGHAAINSTEYRSWRSMKDRCLNPSCPKYHLYGGRGVTVCERWVESFETFLDDMGPKPGPGYSIDRIDSDGNYEPGNCRWATYLEQRHNRRDYRRAHPEAA